MTMYNKVLDEYLKKITVTQTFADSQINTADFPHATLKDLFFAELWNDIEDLRAHSKHKLNALKTSVGNWLSLTPTETERQTLAKGSGLVWENKLLKDVNVVDYISQMLWGNKLEGVIPVPNEFGKFKDQMNHDMERMAFVTSRKDWKPTVVQTVSAKECSL